MQKSGRVELLPTLYQIIPETALLEAEDVAIYQCNEQDGRISRLSCLRAFPRIRTCSMSGYAKATPCSISYWNWKRRSRWIFFDPAFQSGPFTRERFGLCDDQDTTPAYVDVVSPDKWVATVENLAQREVLFTAIDKGVIRIMKRWAGVVAMPC